MEINSTILDWHIELIDTLLWIKSSILINIYIDF